MSVKLEELYKDAAVDVKRLFKAGWTLSEVEAMKEEMSIRYLIAEEDLELLIKAAQKTTVKETKMENAKGGVKVGGVAIGAPAGGHKPAKPAAPKAEKKAAPKVDRVNPKEGEKWVMLNHKNEGTLFIALAGEQHGNDIDVRWSPRRRYFRVQKNLIARDATPAEVKAKMAGETVKVETKPAPKAAAK